MNLTFWIGSIGAILTTAAFVPQVLKAHNTRHTRDLSLVMYVLLAAGLVFWIIYGLILNSIPIICANLVTLGLALYLIYLKIIHG
ncbi:MAG: SemiSWEET transporter [Candidatus Margulisiibacteriota bacterium]